jgi:hypothetical protein
MTTAFRHLIALAALLALAALAWGTLSRGGVETGRAQDDDYYALLQDLIARNADITLSFAAPLAPNAEAQRTVAAGSLEVGADYLCFRENWNDGVRKTCTPLGNLASLTFVVP